MKLLFVSRSLPFHRLGGMESVAWDLARTLAERGHDVSILTTGCPKLPSESVQNGISIRSLDVPSGRYSLRYWKQTVESFARDYHGRVDLVMGIGAGAFSIARSRFAEGVPLVMQVHGTSYRELMSKLSVTQLLSWAKAVRNMYGLVNDFTYRRFDTLVAIGPAVRAALEEMPTRWAVGHVPLVTIANGIDESQFSFDVNARKLVRDRLNIADDAPVLVSASRLHVQKGIAEGLAGFAEARKSRPDLNYIVVGDGPEMARLKALTETSGITEAVHFVGSTPREKLSTMLSAADSFLFTSVRQEGLALGPLEAAAAGLPCVLSSHLAIPGFEAELVDPRSKASVAEGIAAALNKGPTERHSLLPRIYSLAHATDEYEALFHRLVTAA